MDSPGDDNDDSSLVDRLKRRIQESDASLSSQLESITNTTDQTVEATETKTKRKCCAQKAGSKTEKEGMSVSHRKKMKPNDFLSVKEGQLPRGRSTRRSTRVSEVLPDVCYLPLIKPVAELKAPVQALAYLENTCIGSAPGSKMPTHPQHSEVHCTAYALWCVQRVLYTCSFA